MTEAPADLAELFARDPLSHSDKDIDTIVAEFRKMRNQYALGNSMAGSTKPKTPKQKQAASLAERLDLKLDF